MDFKDYFKNANGRGFLASSNNQGEVDIAIYSVPKVQADGTFAFGMTDRLTHENIAQNSKAVYAYSTSPYSGTRFYLQKVKEETEGSLIDEIRKEADRHVHPGVGNLVKFVVYFRVTKSVPLVLEHCTGDHSQHLCELAGNERFDLIKELAKEPEYMCTNCGRFADDKKSLCNPVLLTDIAPSLVL